MKKHLYPGITGDTSVVKLPQWRAEGGSGLISDPGHPRDLYMEGTSNENKLAFKDIYTWGGGDIH